MHHKNGGVLTLFTPSHWNGRLIYLSCIVPWSICTIIVLVKVVQLTILLVICLAIIHCSSLGVPYSSEECSVVWEDQFVWHTSFIIILVRFICIVDVTPSSSMFNFLLGLRLELLSRL